MTNTGDTNQPADYDAEAELAALMAEDADPVVQVFKAIADGAPTDEVAALIAKGPLPSTADLNPFTAEYVETAAVLDGHFDQPDMAFRVLSWLERKSKGRTINVDLSGFSAERQESVFDLVRNGLVRERRYTGGMQDGRRSLKITELGMARLHAAWSAAALVVVG